MSIDWSILQWIQLNLQSDFLDFVMPKITMLGDYGIIWIVFAVILLCVKKYRSCGIILLIGLTIGALIGNLWLKPLIARPRPCWIDAGVQLLIANPTDYSFPSGHTLSAVIGATILTLTNRKFAYAAIPLALLIAFSRLYLYVHFPSDILGGVLIGLNIGIITFGIGKVFWGRLTKKHEDSIPLTR